MILLKLVSLIVWLIGVPFCMGLLPAIFIPEEERTPGNIFLCGYITMLALFELIGIPIVITVIYYGFSLLSYFFMTLSLALSALGILLTWKKWKKGYRLKFWSLSDIRQLRREEKAVFLVFAILVLFQMYMAFTRASFDGDDAYYGVMGLIAQQQDTLYRIDPYTGKSFPLDVRHAMALFPVWEAFVGKMSGIHATIITHSIVPLVLIPLTYLVYFQIGKKLFPGKKDMLSMFVVIMAVFQMFGNVSIYTNETFLLTRTWQGKSVAGNLIIPAVFLLFLCLFAKGGEEEGKADQKVSSAGYFLLLACLNLAAGISSSLAVLLSTLLTAGLAVLFTIRIRNPKILWKCALTCVPGAAYILTYLVVSH